MEIKVEDYVIINENTKIMGYGEAARKERIPVYVYRKNNPREIFCMTKNTAFNKFNNDGFVISSEFLTPISKEKAEKILHKNNLKYVRENRKRIKELKTKHTPTKDRKDYDLTSKSLLITSYNYIKLLVKNSDPNVGRNLLSSSFSITCCDTVKTTTDIVFYIPKSWLNYYGYNLSDIKAWIKFLEKCDIGFNCNIIDTVDLHTEYQQTSSLKNELLLNPTQNYYLSKNEKAYKILLKGGDKNYITYFYFILMRYLYNHRYWNIPFIAMKLKKNMPKTSYWDCLILAHNSELYNQGYCLVYASDSQIYLGSINNQQNILEKLSLNKGMNSAFVATPFSRVTLEHLIKTENYTELQNLLNKYK